MLCVMVDTYCCSFCDLSVHFSVGVYGAPINDGIQAAIILSVIFGMAGVLLTSYYVQRGVHSKS